MAACTIKTEGSKEQEARENRSDTGTLYIFRPSVDYSTIQTPTIHINDVLSFSLPSGTYASLELPQGRYQLKVPKKILRWNFDEVFHELEIEAGQSYYFKLALKMLEKTFVVGNYYTKGKATLIPVSINEGRTGIKATKKVLEETFFFPIESAQNK